MADDLPPPAATVRRRRRRRRNNDTGTDNVDSFNHHGNGHGHADSEAEGLGGGSFALDGDALRRVQEVGKRAALAGKRKIWDTNDASVDMAQGAVDAWESTYLGLRSLLIVGARSAASAYGAVKSAAGGIENGVLVPVRDGVLLPAFAGAEAAAAGAAVFAASEEARHLARGALAIVRRTPLVGETVLAPALCVGADALGTAWAVAQYPIPSRSAVRTTVDGALTVTKLALRNSSRAIYYYMNIVDATITRTMMHTQWKILGSGPYSSLSPDHQREILDHISERYFALSDRHPIARYEFAAHIMAKNRALYDDLVLSGLLLSRAQRNALTKDDDWLSPELPSYWTQEAPLLLLRGKKPAATDLAVLPVWFHLPYVNGERPGKDAPWVRFLTEDERRLENSFETHVQSRVVHDEAISKGDIEASDLSDFDDAMEEEQSVDESVFPDSPRTPEAPPPYVGDFVSREEKQYPTIANWYEPDRRECDVLVDQSRYAISFMSCCSACHGHHEQRAGPIPGVQGLSSLCQDCALSSCPLNHSAKSIPWTNMVMRPTMWRYHGTRTHAVRRATWLLETKRHGLQPYCDESAAVLEDAYMFLKYHCLSGGKDNEASITNIPLSVEVRGPDGDEHQLVQFQSLANVTAIQKTLGGAIQVFKRRVYRGATGVLSQGGTSRRQNGTAVDAKTTINDGCAVNRCSSGGQVKCNSDLEEEDECCNTETWSPSLSIAVPPGPQNQGPQETRAEVVEENADHLVLVVHGIGEMMRSVDVFGMGLPALCSIVDCCGWLRKNHAAVHSAQFADFKDINADSSFTQEDMASAIMGRVEYLPVEWHEAFSLNTQRQAHGSTKGSGATTLKDISLKTIPALRDFANDTLLDVLYFMSPPHHDVIIDIVVKELHEVVRRYQKLTGFRGRISILGHSLGSIISWDIFSNQSSELSRQAGSRLGLLSPFPCSRSTVMLEDPPPERSGQYPQLKFKVDNLFMVGSPVAVFLMLRNQHEPLGEDFSLPGCSRVYNIFHPYDPAAYRIEPLINARNASVDAKIIAHWKGGLRVKYQYKYMLRQIVDETRRTQKNVAEAVEAGIAGMGLFDDDLLDDENDELSSTISSSDSGFQTVECGNLNRGRRIDFMLQEKEIENANEYVFALAAHSSYWNEKDLSSFLARQIFRSNLDADDGCSNESAVLDT